MKPFRNSLTICLHRVLRGTDRCDSIVDPCRYKVCHCKHPNLDSGLRLEGLGWALRVCQCLGSESGKLLAGLLSIHQPSLEPDSATSSSSCVVPVGFILLWRDFLYGTWARCCHGHRSSSLRRLCGRAEAGWQTESLSHQYAGWPSWSVKKFLKIPQSMFLFIFLLFLER